MKVWMSAVEPAFLKNAPPLRVSPLARSSEFPAPRSRVALDFTSKVPCTSRLFPARSNTPPAIVAWVETVKVLMAPPEPLINRVTRA
jgi:hypothetical protein